MTAIAPPMHRAKAIALLVSALLVTALILPVVVTNNLSWTFLAAPSFAESTRFRPFTEALRGVRRFAAAGRAARAGRSGCR